MTCGIYKIANTVTGEVYVGRSIDIEKRWEGHKYSLFRGKHSNRKLQESWDKYGCLCFEWEVITECDKGDLAYWEGYWMRSFDCVFNENIPSERAVLYQKQIVWSTGRKRAKEGEIPGIRWLLSDVMNHHRIGNKELALKLNRHPTAVSRLKSAEELPAIKGSEIVSFAVALTELLKERGYETVITPKDLIGFREDVA